LCSKVFPRTFYEAIILDDFVKSHIQPLFVIPLKLVLDLIGEGESGHFKMFWIPASAGMTDLDTFYDAIILSRQR